MKSDKGLIVAVLIVAMALLIAAYVYAAQPQQPQQQMQCEFTHYGNRIFWVAGPQTPITVPFSVTLEKGETQHDAYMRVLQSVFFGENFIEKYGLEKELEKAAEEYRGTLVSLFRKPQILSGGLRENIAISCKITEGTDEPIRLRTQLRFFVTRY